MQVYWLSHNRAFWSVGNITKKFTGTIHTEETRTNELDLSDKEVRVLIREDYPITELLSKPVTITRRNSIEFLFTEGEVPEIGEWKVEFIILENGEEIGITHHEDFDVR